MKADTIYNNEVTINFECPTDKKTHLTESKIRSLLKPLIEHINKLGSIEKSDIDITLDIEKYD